MQINRLKQLRELLDISQVEFAKKTGLDRSSISLFESGKREIQDRHIKLICQTFNVNEDWLRYGNEPIFKEQSLNLVKQIVDEYKLDKIDEIILINFLKLNPEERKSVISIGQKLLNLPNSPTEIKKENNKIKDFPKQEEKEERVQIIARGKGITTISKEEYDRIIETAEEIDNIDDYF